jgi:hypothetical protein
MRRILVPLILLAVGTLSANGDSPTAAGTAEPGRSRSNVVSPSATEAPASTLPPCAHAGAPVAIPPEFPKNFPLPPGTVITATRRADPATVLEGLIPMELPKATRFFLQNLTAAGYRLGRGEAERGEAEDRFFGNGVIGFFRLRSMRDCPGALELAITVQPMPGTPSPSPEPKSSASAAP